MKLRGDGRQDEDQNEKIESVQRPSEEAGKKGVPRFAGSGWFRLRVRGFGAFFGHGSASSGIAGSDRDRRRER